MLNYTKSFWKLLPGWIGGYYTSAQALLTRTNPHFFSPQKKVLWYIASVQQGQHFQAAPGLTHSAWMTTHWTYSFSKPQVSVNCWVYHSCNMQLTFYKVQCMPKEISFRQKIQTSALHGQTAVELKLFFPFLVWVFEIPQYFTRLRTLLPPIPL